MNRSKQGLAGANFREENATRVTSELSERFVMRIEFLSSSWAALLLVGCQPATPDLKPTDTPVAFELRDFRVKETSSKN
jgi:hypothetical protein